MSSSRQTPLNTRESRGTATYAYRTAPSCERSSPVHSTTSPAHPTIPPVPAPSTSRQLSGRNPVPPPGGPSVPRNHNPTGEPSSSKRQSNRKRKREELKGAASSADIMPSATTKALTPSMLADMQPNQVTQSGGEQAGSGEDVDVTREIVNLEPIRDDPALSMRAGLIVNGVSFLP